MDCPVRNLTCLHPSPFFFFFLPVCSLVILYCSLQKIESALQGLSPFLHTLLLQHPMATFLKVMTAPSLVFEIIHEPWEITGSGNARIAWILFLCKTVIVSPTDLRILCSVSNFLFCWFINIQMLVIWALHLLYSTHPGHHTLRCRACVPCCHQTSARSPMKRSSLAPAVQAVWCDWSSKLVFCFPWPDVLYIAA